MPYAPRRGPAGKRATGLFGRPGSTLAPGFVAGSGDVFQSSKEMSMKTTRLHALMLGARTVAGLALVLAAIAGTASAGAGPPPVPEIDAGSILSAMTLLSGGVMILTDRRRAR